MYKTNEIYEVMKNFEKVVYGRFDKEKNKEDWKKGRWYEDGNINQLFDIYLKGYALGKNMGHIYLEV